MGIPVPGPHTSRSPSSVSSITLVQTGARTMSAGLGIPMSIPYSCMPVGIVLMLLTSIEVLFKNISALRGAGKEAQV